MLKIGKYTIMIVKDKKPADLHKQTTKKEELYEIITDNQQKINVILLILLLILSLLLCYMVVPQTYGFYHW